MNYNWKYPQYIVECEWLENQLNNEDIRIFDCTTYLHYTDDHPSKPYDVESGYLKYKKSHIPGSGFIDLQKDLSDQSSPYSFTLPNYKLLAKSFKNLGIGDPFHIVLYSSNGMQWSTRVWWMLYYIGFKNVSILNGGFEEWNRLCFPIATGENKFESADFNVVPKQNLFIEKDKVLSSINDKSCIILNALTADLHMGINKRYGRPGRIPGSINIPFHEFIEKKTGKLKSPKQLLKIIIEKNINYDHQIINYCGGGIAATLDAFVLMQLGYSQLKIYDNSMSEWAMDKNLPIEV